MKIDFKNEKLIPKLFLKILDKVSTRQKSWIVGGALRDIFFGKKIRDLDVVLEKGVFEISKKFEKTLGKFDYFENFRTSRFELENGLSLGFSTLRKESYEKNGNLPICDFDKVSLSDDLHRRDFTINSIAVSVKKNGDWILEDCSKGFIDDLKKKNWRIFHKDSFIDDPTRIIRLARYRKSIEKSSLDPMTVEALKDERLKDVALKVSPDRWANEIKKGDFFDFEDELSEFQEYQSFKQIFNGDWVEPRFSREKNALWKVLSCCRGPDAPFTWARLGASKKLIKVLNPLGSNEWPEFNKNWNLLQMDNLMSSWDPFLISLAKQEIDKERKSLLDKYLNLRDSIEFPTGNDLKEIGLKGKEIGYFIKISRKAVFKEQSDPDRKSILDWIKNNV